MLYGKSSAITEYKECTELSHYTFAVHDSRAV